MSEGTWEVGGLIASAFISATIAPGGSEAVLAYLVDQGRHSTLNLVLLAALANTLGAMTTWALGALAARKFPVSEVLPPRKQRALSTVRKYGQWSLFFSWLPIIGDALCFAAGWLQMPVGSGTVIIGLGKLARYGVIAWMFS